MIFQRRRGSVGPVIFRGVIQHTRCAGALLLLSMIASCSSHPNAPPPAPDAVLQAIPAADPAQYDHIQNMKQWRNPYLIVRSDGVALYDSADSAEIILKPEEVLPALAKLPGSYWPYGRVVAATESAMRTSEQDGIALRRNKGIVGGMLEDAHIAIKWVPAL
jgi:hypothetical protein